MTWIRQRLAPSPHLLDPESTVEASKAYWLKTATVHSLTQAIRDHERALEHEQAVLTGMYQALEVLHVTAHQRSA